MQVVLQTWQEPHLLRLWEAILQNMSQEQPWPKLHQAGRARSLDLSLLRLQAPGQDQEPALGLRGAGEGIQSAYEDGKPVKDDQTNIQPSLLGIKAAHIEAWPSAQSPRSPSDQTSHTQDSGTSATRTDS